MKRILVTICGRAGSKGVKSKNIREFLGIPICYYTLAALRLFRERYPEYGEVTLAVNTDSEQLFSQFDRAGESYLRIPRRESLAGDTASKVDVIRDTLAAACEQTGQVFDVVVDMDLTSPLRRVEDVKNIIDTLFATEGAEVALSVTEARRSPYFNQLNKKENGYYSTVIESDFVARQQAPTIYDANASLYAYSPHYLRESTTILIKSRLAVSVMPDTAVLDIDSENDFQLMELLARHFYDSDPAFREVWEAAVGYAR